MLEFSVHLRVRLPVTSNREPYRLAVSPCERGEDPAEDRDGLGRMRWALSLDIGIVTRGSAGKESGSHGSPPKLWLSDAGVPSLGLI